MLKNTVCCLATPAEGYSTALQDPGVRPRFLQQRTPQALGMFLGPRRDWAPDYGSPRDQADLLVSWALSDPQSHTFRQTKQWFILTELTSTQYIGSPFLSSVNPPRLSCEVLENTWSIIMYITYHCLKYHIFGKSSGGNGHMTMGWTFLTKYLSSRSSQHRQSDGAGHPAGLRCWPPGFSIHALTLAHKYMFLKHIKIILLVR